MPFEMMDADRGHVQCECEASGEGRANQEGTREARPLGIGDGIDLRELAACACGYFASKRHDPPDVVARGEFGNDATVVLVHRNLGVERMREQPQLAVVKREPGFVAGGFDAEDQHVIDLKGMCLQSKRAV